MNQKKKSASQKEKLSSKKIKNKKNRHGQFTFYT